MNQSSLLSSFWDGFINSTFGSDELQSYSAQYTWLANQMAHAMMGFFLVCFCHWFPLSRCCRTWGMLPRCAQRWWKIGPWVRRIRLCVRRWPHKRLVVPFFIPSTKVFLDALVIASQSYRFPISWSEFGWDKITDLSFWFFGMFLGLILVGWVRGFYDKARASYLGRAWCRGLLTLAAVVACLYVLFGIWYPYWVEQKRFYDRSNLPPGWVRLCQYDTNKVFPTAHLHEIAKQEAEDGKRRTMEENTMTYFRSVFEEKPTAPVHVVIRGGWPEDRHRLAVALGSEYAARSRAVYYTKAARVLEDPEDLLRWEHLAKKLTPTVPRDAKHPYFPQCFILDDLAHAFIYDPKKQTYLFPTINPATLEEPSLEKAQERYDATIRFRFLVEWMYYKVHVEKHAINTIWVPSCNDNDSQLWLKALRDTFEKDGQRVIDIYLGNPQAR